MNKTLNYHKAKIQKTLILCYIGKSTHVKAHGQLRVLKIGINNTVLVLIAAVSFDFMTSQFCCMC